MGKKHIASKPTASKGKGIAVEKPPKLRRRLSDSESDSDDEGFEPEVEPLMADAGAGLPKKQKKKRTQAEMKRDRKKEWVESIQTRNFKNERQVDDLSLKERFGVLEIKREGLEKWFEPLPGYNIQCVREFYTHVEMVVDDTTSLPTMLKSKVGKKPIVMTPDLIAEYLGYVRPDPSTINYPRVEPLDPTYVRATLFEEPEHVTYPIKPSSFKLFARVLNQAIHYNIYPRGTENKPSGKSAELLTAFTDETIVVDWALYIFGQICDFVEGTQLNSRMWFPCMITTMCQKQGVTSQAYKKMEKLDPGIVDMSTLQRSKSQSRGARDKASKASQAAAPTAGPSSSRHIPSSPKPWSKVKTPPKGSRMVAWFKQMLKCHRAGLKNQEKIMKKQEKWERGQKRMMQRPIGLLSNWRHLRVRDMYPLPSLMSPRRRRKLKKGRRRMNPFPRMIEDMVVDGDS